MSDETVIEEPQAGQRGISRRDMIKRAAVAGGVVWTAPVIFDSLASPAAASTLPPCPLGPAYAVMYSPPNAVALVDRVPAGTGFEAVTHGSCTDPALAVGAPCRAPAAGRTRTFAGSISLQVQGININHNINNQVTGPQDAVNITLAQDSCCEIEAVYAYVHRFGAATNPDCPPTTYCQQATDAGPYFLRVVNNAKSWTVFPSASESLCDGQGVHWGSPNQDPDCVGFDSDARADGMSFGYLLILLDCEGEGPA